MTLGVMDRRYLELLRYAIAVLIGQLPAQISKLMPQFSSSSTALIEINHGIHR